jgi:hypothetical protein
MIAFIGAILFFFAVVALVGAIAGMMNDSNNRYPGALLLAALVMGILGYMMLPAAAHDHGRPEYHQWESTTDPETREWMKSLMQPDNPTTSCCGEADGYWCDNYRSEKGRAFCTISDDRPDAPRGRPHVPVGTVIEIPPHKLKWDRGNPTGHGVVFLSRERYVFCYVQAGGA